MFAKFDLPIEEIHQLKAFSESQPEYHVKPIDLDVVRKTIRPKLRLLVKGKDSSAIDGEVLKNYVFPTGDKNSYDVFISYSHKDQNEAIFLASWLEQQCGLRVFLDYYIWGSANGLLKEIDDLFCKQKNGMYDYRRRNYSTSHVHAMLSMAIMDIINNTECCIFINSRHSIYLSSLCKTQTAKTLSPWIYEENKMMMLLPSHTDEREVRYFSDTKKTMLSESLTQLMMSHGINFNGFMKLTYEKLKNLRNKGISGLNELYGSFVGIEIS